MTVKPKSGGAISPWPKRRPRDASFDERKRAVLTAAARLFVERGFEGGSFDELAVRLNVSKPTIYYYTGSKEECYFQIMLEAQQGIIDAMGPIMAREGVALEKLIAFLEVYISNVQTDFGRCLMTLGRSHLTGERRKAIEQRIQLVDRKVIALLRQGMSDGTIRRQDPKIAFHTMFGAINWTVLWYHPTGTLKVGQLVEAQISFLLDGLRGPALERLSYPPPP